MVPQLPAGEARKGVVVRTEYVSARLDDGWCSTLQFTVIRWSRPEPHQRRQVGRCQNTDLKGVIHGQVQSNRITGRGLLNPKPVIPQVRI
jgi:hypothetical protein